MSRSEYFVLPDCYVVAPIQLVERDLLNEIDRLSAELIRVKRMIFEKGSGTHVVGEEIYEDYDI